jgi:hypothetical protein
MTSMSFVSATLMIAPDVDESLFRLLDRRNVDRRRIAGTGERRTAPIGRNDRLACRRGQLATE